jgi:WD40 repeat protein
LEQKKTLGTLSDKPINMADNLFQIKGEQSYDVKVMSDKDFCNIRSVCCMEDGTIILADNINRKLKRLHSYYYTVSDHCDLPGEPWQVCMINNTQIAVTVPSKKEIHFISLLGRQMKTVNWFNTDFVCHGLAYANKNLYISDSQTFVYMYTLSGRKLQQFSKDQLGHKLFSSICSLAVSQDATRIYVADYNNGLIVLDNNGQVISLFNDRQLKGATCCYLSEAGGVLVSGCGSNNVLQFTPDGKLMGEVIKDDSRKGGTGIFSLLMEKISVPVQEGIPSVCCNQQMTKMCISRLTDDNIVVYDISSVK